MTKRPKRPPRATANGARAPATSTARRSERRALRLEVQHFLDLVAGKGDPLEAARDGVVVVRALEQLQSPLVQTPRDGRGNGRRLPGHGARGGLRRGRPRGRRQAARALAPLDGQARGAAAARRRRPARSSRPERSSSPARRSARTCIVGDQLCARERCELGDDVVVGRGSLVENDTTIGARTKIQADAYARPTRRSRRTCSSRPAS